MKEIKFQVRQTGYDDKEGEIIVFIINGDVEDFLGWHKYRKRKWRGWHLALVQYANEK